MGTLGGSVSEDIFSISWPLECFLVSFHLLAEVLDLCPVSFPLSEVSSLGPKEGKRQSNSEKRRGEEGGISTTGDVGMFINGDENEKPQKTQGLVYVSFLPTVLLGTRYF